MDPVTHAAFAACCAVGAVRDRARQRTAALAGIAGGLWPDADILLRSAEDPLFQLEYHRHFTHSLVCSPLVATTAGHLRAAEATVSRPSSRRPVQHRPGAAARGGSRGWSDHSSRVRLAILKKVRLHLWRWLPFQV